MYFSECIHNINRISFVHNFVYLHARYAPVSSLHFMPMVELVQDFCCCFSDFSTNLKRGYRQLGSDVFCLLDV